jgi:hypothetical protein
MKTDTPFPPGCCRNCGAALTGRYCSQCGQRETGRDLRFSDLISEFFGEIFTWDSRIWRTLFPLLFRPGFLTAEFIAGRRARYVPPLRLYLIISFILFLSLSLSNLMEIDNNGSPVEDVVRIVDDPNDASATGLVRIDLGSEEEEGTDAGVDVPGVDEGDGISIGLADEDSPPWLQKLERQVEKNAASLEGEPGEFVGELLEYLPQMMFLMLPLFALLLRICYLFSPYHYLQHLVFSLNYHSFTFLLYLIQMVVERIGGDFGGLFFLCLLVYLPIGLRRVFHSGVAAAIGKALFIYFTYGIMLAVGFAAAAVLALFQM